MKLEKNAGGWIVTDGKSVNIFESAHDAWLYIFILKEIRSSTTRLPKTLYPVKTLDPRPKVVKRYVQNFGG